MAQTPDSITRNLITDLRLSDEDTGGRPVLPPDMVGTARAFLERLLLNATEWYEHIQLLNRLYGGEFRAPLPRTWRHGIDLPLPPEATAHFRHNEVLPEALAAEVLERGVGRLPADVLAQLLLSPLAIWDLGDLVCTEYSEYWLDRMNSRGVEIAREHGIDLFEDFEEVVGAPLPARPDADPLTFPLYEWCENELQEEEDARLEAAFADRDVRQRTQSGSREKEPKKWPIRLKVPADERARIGPTAFHDAKTPFDLWLYRVTGPAGEVEDELAIRPAPRRADVKVRVRFPTGEVVEFVLEVPPETKVDAALTRGEMRSGLSGPLPEEAFAIPVGGMAS